MSIKAWNKDIVGVAQAFEARGPSPGSRGESSALLVWAVWTADSLYYLEDLTDANRSRSSLQQSHDDATKAIAHLRWASGSSITAIDLCSAVIARELGLWSGGNELDERRLDKKRKSIPMETVSSWPVEVVAWLDRLKADPDYPVILKSRNPLTHSRLIRHFTLSDSSIRVVVKGTRYTTDELIVKARDLARRHVEAFIKVIESL